MSEVDDAATGQTPDTAARNLVIGTPVQQGNTTLVPAVRVRKAGMLVAKPAGAWIISEDGKGSWHPSVNVNHIVLGGQIALSAAIVAVTALVLHRRCTK